jgi:hypothetical protein
MTNCLNQIGDNNYDCYHLSQPEDAHGRVIDILCSNDDFDHEQYIDEAVNNNKLLTAIMCSKNKGSLFTFLFVLNLPFCFNDDLPTPWIR